jgi:enamine deaminase RidA (YjgF/YER057c/UK114 family)
LTQAEAICRDAGTSLKDAVRIQQFHTDLAEGRNGPLPLSPVEVPWLPVPDARLQLDLWVYIPD